MNTFKLGDQVRVYQVMGTYTGVIVHIDESVVYTRSGDDSRAVFPAHYKQCRKLKSLEPKRRVWIAPGQIGNEYIPHYNITFNSNELGLAGWVEFVEVKRRKV
jgi:hypothetical protein